MTKQLFARKFDPLNEDSMRLLDFVEILRNHDEGLQGLYNLDYGDKVMILTKKPTSMGDNTRRNKGKYGDRRLEDGIEGDGQKDNDDEVDDDAIYYDNSEDHGKDTGRHESMASVDEGKDDVKDGSC